MTTTKTYIQFEIRNKKGTPVYWGTAPIETADQHIVAAFRACPAASYVTSREVTIEESEPEEGSDSSSVWIEATLWSSSGEFVMRSYFSSEEEYEAEIASLLKACPSAVSVSVREVQ